MNTWQSIPTKSEIDALTTRIAALEQQLAVLQANIASAKGEGREASAPAIPPHPYRLVQRKYNLWDVMMNDDAMGSYLVEQDSKPQWVPVFKDTDQSIGIWSEFEAKAHFNRLVAEWNHEHGAKGEPEKALEKVRVVPRESGYDVERDGVAGCYEPSTGEWRSFHRAPANGAFNDRDIAEAVAAALNAREVKP